MFNIELLNVKVNREINDNESREDNETADQTLREDDVKNLDKGTRVSPKALMPPPSMSGFSQPSLPFDPQRFWQQYAENIAKYGPFMAQNSTTIVPALTQIKTKNKPGRPKKISLDEDDIELDEESTRKRSKSNSITSQARNQNKSREASSDLGDKLSEQNRTNSTEIDRLKIEIDRLKNRLLKVELESASQIEEIKTLKNNNQQNVSILD